MLHVKRLWSFRYILKRLIDNGRFWSVSDSTNRPRFCRGRHYRTDRRWRFVDTRSGCQDTFADFELISESLSLSYIHTRTRARARIHTYTHAPFRPFILSCLIRSLTFSLSLSIHSLPIQTYSAFPYTAKRLHDHSASMLRYLLSP